MSDFAELVLLVGRVLFAVMFLNAAKGHYANGEMMISVAKKAGMPGASLASWPAALWLAGGSLSIVLGVFPDVGALMLAFFVVPAAAYFHRYWTFDDPQERAGQLRDFTRNVTLCGAGLMLFVFFATAGYALDWTITDPLFDLR